MKTVFQIIVCVVSILFAALSLVAALSQLKSRKGMASAVLMAVGSLLLIIGAAYCFAGLWFDYIPAAVGCAGICAAAICNGLKSEQLHIRHHVIRIALSAALVTGLVLL